jgi:eukaryotic-like serine/threonine-protein kinase
MNDPRTIDDGPDSSADEPLTADAEWVARLSDRISLGESIDWETETAECPERLRSFLPTMRKMVRLRNHPPKNVVSEADPVVNPVETMPILADFRTVKLIGRGGMGIVYEAVQLSLNRRVALKILPTLSAIDPLRLTRFQIEAQAAACLNHPHIVPVYSVGSEDGLYYYSMQLIEGQTLAEVVAFYSRRKGPRGRQHRDGLTAPTDAAQSLSPRLAAEFGRQAAAALHFAHEQGVVHRDVKPSNLIIEPSAWLWVTDFGLARMPGGGDLTATGLLVGTPRYMSPEQAVGSRATVDHRTDVYSLGVSLYELIALEPAFDDDDRLELLRKIVQEEPRPPRCIDPSIPADLETIVLKAMAKEPCERYSTAGELAEDLGRFLENRPILARPPSAIDRAAKWARRHRPAVVAAGVIVLASAISLGGAILWRDGLIRRHNDELRSALIQTERNESLSRQLLYDSRMRLAQQSWEAGQVELAQELLESLRPEMGERDRRGFEWRYLWRICHRDVSVLTDHEATSLILSPDGRTVFSGDGYGSLVIWDLAAGREFIRIQGHEREVSGLLLSPNGRTLASWSTTEGLPSDVKLWDAVTGRHLATIPGIAGYVITLGFSTDGRVMVFLEHDVNGDSSKNRMVFWGLARSPERPVPCAAAIVCDKMACSADGRWLATGLLTDNTVTLRDAATGQPVKTLTGPFPGIGGLDFSNDGHTLASHSRGITLWDTESGRERGSLPFHLWRDAAFSPDGNRLAGATTTRDSIELIADVKTNPRVVRLDKISGKDHHFAFSPDGKTIAGGGIGLPATLWDTTSGRKLAEFPGKAGNVGCMVFAPGGETLIFASEDGRILSWHFVKERDPISQLAGHKAEVWGLAYTPDGTTLISSSDDFSIKLWNARDGELLSTLKGHSLLVASTASSPDGKLLASAGFDKTVRLWDLPGGGPRAVLRGHTDRVRAVAFSPDGRHLASASSDKMVRIWDVDRGEPILVFKGHTDTVRALAFTPSGAFLVSSSDDRTIRGIEVEGGREAFSLPCPKHNSALAFSPDGSFLASGDDQGNLTIWDAATWSRRRSVKGSDTAIWGLSYSPDGRTLAAACGDAKVRLWDPITGQVILVLDGHAQRVNAVAFSPDGSTLASGSHDGAIRLWSAK